MLPENLSTLIDMYRQKVQGQGQGHFLPRWRMEFLYTDLANISLGHKNFYGWLAVVTAEKVLPLFIAEMPQEKAPLRLIKLAKRICQGSIAAESRRVTVYSD